MKILMKKISHQDLIIKTNVGVFVAENNIKYTKIMKILPALSFALMFLLFSLFVFKYKDVDEISFMDIFCTIVVSTIAMLIFSYASISRYIIAGAIGWPPYNSLDEYSSINSVSWIYLEPLSFVIVFLSYITLSRM